LPWWSVTRRRPWPTPQVANSLFESFQAGLRELGYVEGRNLIIVFRGAEPHTGQLGELAAELVRLKVDVIVTAGSAATAAAKHATGTIPIVFGSAVDVIGRGFVASFARPGGNITGLAMAAYNLKRLQLLAEVLSGASRMAVLYDPTSFVTEKSLQNELDEHQAGARTLRVNRSPFRCARLAT
jgi:putative tryptophan/tyrosine transport system substrate-binding protein